MKSYPIVDNFTQALLATRSLGTQAMWATQKKSEKSKVFRRYRCQVVRNTVDHVLRNTVREELTWIFVTECRSQSRRKCVFQYIVEFETSFKLTRELTAVKLQKRSKSRSQLMHQGAASIFLGCRRGLQLWYFQIWRRSWYW